MKIASVAITANAAQMVKVAVVMINASAATIANAHRKITAVVAVVVMKNKANMTEGSACCSSLKHPNHAENLPRLNRISGQIEGVKKMIEEGRYCPDILIQLKAIRSAIRAVESNILARHLHHCVAQSFASTSERDKKIDELKVLFDRFEE